MAIEAPTYRGFRYPAEIISHCVRPYHRFPLSFREVQEMMAQRVSWSPTRRFGSGARSSARAMPTHYAEAGLARGIGGSGAGATRNDVPVRHLE